MKRRGILAALFAGTASAQVMRLLPSGDEVKVKPLNGQCPTCGLQAAKIPMQRGLRECRSSVNSVFTVCDEGQPIAGYSIVRCAFCSTAFWQDSE